MIEMPNDKRTNLDLVFAEKIIAFLENMLEKKLDYEYLKFQSGRNYLKIRLKGNVISFDLNGFLYSANYLVHGFQWQTRYNLKEKCMEIIIK